MPRTLSRLALLTTLLAAVVCRAAPASQPDKKAEWTVLVFMNGDNNLEEYMLRDLREMAKVGSTDKVNIVVQLDRIGRYYETSPQWSQTLRFRVTRGMRLGPESAVEDVGEANMGDPKVLSSFVTWGMAQYPARRYMLIISDHGQGWKNIRVPLRDASPGESKEALPRSVARDPFRSARSSPYRSVSHDETSNDELYNSETASALAAALGNGKLDVLGFDACLMAMVESAYAFRSVAKVMVASEDLEPGTGWQYNDWLGALTARPTLEATEMGRLLVDSYRRRYAEPPDELLPDDTTTLSAIDLGGMEALATAISDLSRTLMRKRDAELPRLKAAREACKHIAPDTYGDGFDYFFHIDFIRFCQQLEERTTDQEIRAKASAAASAAKRVVLANYAGQRRHGNYGASGLAIYFPPGRSAYVNDAIAERRYQRDNAEYKVEFVEKHAWVDFLHSYFEVVP